MTVTFMIKNRPRSKRTGICGTVQFTYDSDKRKSPALEELLDIIKYRDLIFQLVRRDIVARYKRSVLGIAWTMLQPLGMMIILTIVFSQLFGRVEGYAAYLLGGLIAWTFFAQDHHVGHSAKCVGRRVDESHLRSLHCLLGSVDWHRRCQPDAFSCSASGDDTDPAPTHHAGNPFPACGYIVNGSLCPGRRVIVIQPGSALPGYFRDVSDYPPGLDVFDADHVSVRYPSRSISKVATLFQPDVLPDPDVPGANL